MLIDPPKPDPFDEFYNRYPTHKARGTATTAYAKALKTVDHDTIMAGLERMLPELTAAKHRGFCPLPASWLNAARWTDEPSGIITHPSTTAGARSSARARLAERLEQSQARQDHYGTVFTTQAVGE